MDDSDRAVTINSVIPAKAGIQPRLVGLALLAGLLVLVGAGCQTTKSNQAEIDSAEKHFDFQRLAFKRVGSHSRIDGLQVVCSLDNAQVLFPTFFDATTTKNLVAEKKNDGWELARFCFKDDFGWAGVFIRHSADSGKSDGELIQVASRALGQQNDVQVSEPTKVATGTAIGDILFPSLFAYTSAEPDATSAEIRIVTSFDKVDRGIIVYREYTVDLLTEQLTAVGDIEDDYSGNH